MLNNHFSTVYVLCRSKAFTILMLSKAAVSAAAVPCVLLHHHFTLTCLFSCFSLIKTFQRIAFSINPEDNGVRLSQRWGTTPYHPRNILKIKYRTTTGLSPYCPMSKKYQEAFDELVLTAVVECLPLILNTHDFSH